ncbi:hypothetical protein [Pseudomonas serbica]|uniref:hypothetical protein n=1 Tax=Pseudomonas serbica TaxID=2965074 RepID=UPI00237B3598|nr:hypothetical protein [Pseudomonas serbica]
MTTFDLLMKSVKDSGQLVERQPESTAELPPEATPVAQSKRYLALQKTGRRANGNERDHGSVVHAVKSGAWDAFCGAHPQGSSDWSCTESEAVTCDRCLLKIASLSDGQ